MRGSGGTFLLIIIIVGLVLGTLILKSPKATESNSSANQTAQATQAPAGAPADPSVVNRDSAPIEGSKDAKVKIVVFSDFLCPYCKNLHATLNKILDDNSGKVSVEYRSFIVHPDAKILHQAAEAANNQSKFKEMADLLFGDEAVSPNEDAIVAAAQKIGLNVDKFKSNLNSKDVQDKIDADNAAAQKLGLGGTPSLFVNNLPFQNSAQLEDQIKAEIDK